MSDGWPSYASTRPQNTDPEPWAVVGRLYWRNAEYERQKFDIWLPRAEYDVPRELPENGYLTQIRDIIKRNNYRSVHKIMQWALLTIELSIYDTTVNPFNNKYSSTQKHHALKVIRRWLAIYGEGV